VSLAFYMDVHVPRAITSALRLRGIDVLTAQEDGSAELGSASKIATRASLALSMHTNSG